MQQELDLKTLEQSLKNADAENQELNFIYNQSQVTNQELNDKLDLERTNVEKARNDLAMLQIERYIVDEKTLEQSDEQRLSDIEM